MAGQPAVDGTPFGRYRLVGLLGRGGMGEVWRAYDTAHNNRTVAIKLLPLHLASDRTYEQRFRREADAAAQLNNPHIIPIHSYGEIDGRLYVDMRLVEGRNLEELLSGGRLEPGRAVRIIEQVATALQAAHRIGLVHRDVKPSNILLDEDDFAYLIDFGIARGVDETSLTGGGMIGSWHYMAPERLRAHEVDARADIYALACVLYECLTGSRPFPGDSMESQVAAHLTDPPPQPSTTQPNVPAQFDAVISTGMAKEPGLRYGTTKDLARAARAALTTQRLNRGPDPHGTAHQARPPTPVQLALRYVARTDQGLGGGINEDSVYAGARLLAVADGIGDPLGGDVASQTMIAALAALDNEEPGDDILGKLDAAVRTARFAMDSVAWTNPEYAGMGTTLTAILFAGNRLGLAHIGGSRGYLLRHGELTQITADENTMMGPMDDVGRPKSGEHSSMMRRLRRDEGPTLAMREARAGDCYLLCTHGLSDYVGDRTIREKLLQVPDIAECATTLIELGLRSGGGDNVTVVIAEVIDWSPQTGSGHDQVTHLN